MALHKLIVRFSPSKTQDFMIDKVELTIGRKPDNDIVIDMPVVSGRHAKVIHEGDKITLEDLGSTNGTFVNKKKITKAVLNHKDIIYIGKSQIMYVTDDPVKVLEANDKNDDLDATMVLQTKAHSAMGGGGAAPKKGGVGGLSVIEGDTEKSEYQLEARLCTIGKVETSTVIIKGLLAPKTAALINRTDTGYVISQPSGGSKVKVNGAQVEGRVALKEGDIIECYGYKFQFFAG